MVRKEIKQFVCAAVIGVDLVGQLFVLGIFEKQFYADRFETFTVIAALNTLVYYLADFIYLRHGHSVFIPGWKFSVFMDSTIIALYGLIYLSEFYKSADIFTQKGLLLLWVGLPVMMIIDWLINEKRHMHFRFIWIALFLPSVYICLALVLGYFKRGFGMDGAMWPYPFLNADQLGWKLVFESVGIRYVLWLILGWLLVRIDRKAGKRRKY